MALPTFKDAMDGMSWNWKIGASLLGPYLDGKSLVACCKVSKDFNKHFLPVLWYNPLSITMTKKRPFLKTVMFMHSARRASREQRSFVRTFDLGRFYHAIGNVVTEQCDESFDDFWFLSRSQLFPEVQFAIMDKAPQAYFPPSEPSWPTRSMLRQWSRQRQTSERRRSTAKYEPTYESTSSASASEEQRTQASPDDMRPLLFSAFGCHESSGSNLVCSFSTSNLMYLDLSYTKVHPSHKAILPTVRVGFPNVRVLKLRGLRITDAELLKLTQIENGKLWSLDLTDNLLTDAAVQQLVSHRFMLDKFQAKAPRYDLPDQGLFEEEPDYQRGLHGEEFDTTAPLRPDNPGKFMEYIEKNGSFPSINDQVLDIGDPLLRHTGLTHLYISKNKFTSFGIEILLDRGNRLQVLDVGSVVAVGSIVPKAGTSGITHLAQADPTSIRSISRQVRSRMENLRIHHSVVTYVPTIVSNALRGTYFTLQSLYIAETVDGSRRRDFAKRTIFPEALSPLQNHGLTKLTLTDIPTKSYGLTIERLLAFLAECKVQEELLAEARKFTRNNRRSPRLLPGLRTLCLEFIPEDTHPQSPSGFSVSGDRDADEFLASSEGDFSFFDDPNTMSSVSRRGSVATTAGPATPTSRKSSVTGGGLLKRAMSTSSRPGSSGSEASVPSKAPPKEPPAYTREVVKDVVAELKKYRSQKEGRWTGDLQLVFEHGR